MMKKKYLPVIAIILMMVVTHVLAIGVVNIFPSEYKAFGEDTNDPLNPLIYIAFIIIFTAVMLIVLKYTKGNFLKYLILGIVALTLFYVFYPVLFYFSYPLLVKIGYDLAFYAAVIMAIALTAVLYKHPEWYVVDTLAVIMGAGIAGIFGMSFAILPVFVLLIALAVYDFISVYKTKHMISLADGIMKMKVPVMMVVPRKRGYKFKEKEGVMQEVKDKKKKRDAMFIGLGDFIIPGILAVSASIYLPSAVVFGLSAPLIVAAGSIIGAVCGMLVLMRFVLKGNPQAGLPFLNSGAIIGYMLTYLAVYNNYTFGIVFPW
ncbi:MAG: presenilin family intramembrane aspartyl protease PSH [Thermoplasmatota archaeon]